MSIDEKKLKKEEKPFTSIEDLIQSSDEESLSDNSVKSQLTQKEAEIKRKEIERLTKQTATKSGVPYVDLIGFAISPEALALIPEEEARRLSTVCFYYDGNNLRLGTIQPNNKEVRDLLKQMIEKYFCEGGIYLISDHGLNFGLELYKALPKIRDVKRGVKINQTELNKYSEKFSSFKDLQKQIDQAQITEMVVMIMAAAIQSRASDIHIEGEEKDIKIRFRIDGVLHDAAIISREVWTHLISRMKMLAKVKINITERPQDGRVTLLLADEKIDIRASFLPTAFGESVVMRLLHSSSMGLPFEELGLTGKSYEQLKREIERPNGMIITTGPTGSGKTTSLYAILKKLNKPETKIITIEDPIEYQLEGVNQSQISENYNFAKGLRSIVRQDPDVIMVGEIRDLETAEIAIQAALTGHLVLSTIHTNDAAGTVPRLLSMGAKPFLIAPALNAMMGQRLVRRICQECKQEAKLDEEKFKRVKEHLESLPAEEKKQVDFNNLKFYKGAGCEACQTIGYKGRVGIYEVFVMDKEIEKIILSGKVSEYEMRDVAANKGMITMTQDGLLKALQGITSVDEIFRVAD